MVMVLLTKVAVSAVSLWPRDRRFTPPELAFFVALLIFVVNQFALAGAAMMIRGPEIGKDIYRLIFSIFTLTASVLTLSIMYSRWRSL